MPISPAAERTRRLGWLLFLAALLLPLGCDLTAPAGEPPGGDQPYQQRLPLVVGPPTSAGEQPTSAYPAPVEPTEAPQIEVGVTLQADRQELRVGEAARLTAAVTVESQECSYPLYEISLQEITPGQVEFASPQVVGPPGQSPSTFEVRPRQPGQVSLYARAYGEIDCGQGMYWQYFTSEPLVLQVSE